MANYRIQDNNKIILIIELGIKEEPLPDTSDISSELSRFKNVLISETDDFGPMGGRFQLQTEDQHPETLGTSSCFSLKLWVHL